LDINELSALFATSLTEISKDFGLLFYLPKWIKRRLAELEEQIKIYLGYVFLEKGICDDQNIIDDMIARINDALQEAKRLKVIE
jgi:hypothetical protein